jgi:hypothetical protein
MCEAVHIMIAKTTNQRKADERARKRERGLIKVEYWIRPEHKDKLNRYVKRLSVP